MKHCYERVRRIRNKNYREEYIFSWGYFRAIRTSGEIRANSNDRADAELRAYRVKVRLRRCEAKLDSRNDFSIARNFGKSWKDYTKNKRQWEPKGAIKDRI